MASEAHQLAGAWSGWAGQIRACGKKKPVGPRSINYAPCCAFLLVPPTCRGRYPTQRINSYFEETNFELLFSFLDLTERQPKFSQQRKATVLYQSWRTIQMLLQVQDN